MSYKPLALLCALTGHKRSLKHARQTRTGAVFSVCKRCDAPMIKGAQGWVVQAD